MMLAADEPSVKREEALEYLQKAGPAWAAKIPAGHGRLFYLESEWEREAESIRTLTGIGAEYRKLLFDAADRIAESPVLEYRTPEEMVTPGRTLLSALEEGWQRGVGNEMVCLALAAKVDPREGYLSKLREMVLTACRYPTWGREGKQGELADMDLAAGHIVRGIAIVYDWHRGIFSEAERSMIRETIQKRVHRLLEGVYGGIYWSNWYTQNHNHICVAGLGLAGLAFYEEIAEAPEWLAAASLNFQKAARLLDPDGSSYEGLPYWGYGRSFILQFVEGTRKVAGTDDIYQEPAFRNAIAYRLGCSTPGFGGVLMWSDSRGFDAYGPQHILYRLAAQYGDGKGQYLADHLPFVPQGGADNLAWTVLWYDPAVVPVPPVACDYHATLWDVVTTRSGWGDGDYMVSLKSGLNRNHHTQLDAGSLSLNFGGEWLLLTSGYGLGVGKDGFFDQNGKRWTFLSGATESHSTLLVDGRNQRFDAEARGRVDRYVSSPSWLWVETDLTDAYYHVQAARRRLLHARGDYMLVFDEVSAKTPKTVKWLAQVPPDARNNGRDLLVDGIRGSLAIRLVGEAGDFTLHKPLSKVLDVSPSRLVTYSSQSTGTDVRLSTLLQPVFGGGTSPGRLSARRDDTATGSHLEIKGDGWRDEVWMLRTRGDIASGEMKITAEAALVRRLETGTPTSVAAVGTTQMACGPLSLRSAEPFDLILEGAGHGRWLLSLGTPFSGKMVLPEGLHLFTAEGQPADGIRPGRYLIARDGDDARALDKSLASLFPPRKAVATWPVREPLPQEPAPSEITVRQECEDAAIQTRGLAKVVQDASASAGAALTSFGTESPAHSVGWKVHVARAGTYRVKLRYAVAQPSVTFTLLVDGSIPGSQAEKITVAGPKGWGAEKYWTLTTSGWDESILTDAAGRPLEISLPEGEHEIRIAGPSSGMNLDRWELEGAATRQTP